MSEYAVFGRCRVGMRTLVIANYEIEVRASRLDRISLWRGYT